MNGEPRGRARPSAPPDILQKRFEVTIDQVVDLLNEALRMDKNALRDFCEERITVNKDLANHPTIQCVQDGKRFEMGFLGFIQGMFGADEEEKGPIDAVIDPKTKAIIEFKVREPWQGAMGPTPAA